MIITARYFGDTRSGRGIYAYGTKNLAYIRAQTKDLTARDHFDAVCLFQFLMVRALRQDGEDSAEFEIMFFMSYYHQSQISQEVIATQKALLSLVTSIDVSKFGESLVKHFLLK